MKIAILHPDFNIFGGAERVIINLAKGLKQKGHHIEIFAFAYHHQEIKKIFNSLEIPFHLPNLNKIINFAYNFKIGGWSIRNCFKDFDIINVHNFPAYICLYYAKRFAKYKFPEIIWVCNEPPKILYAELLYKNSLKLPAFLKSYEKENQALINIRRNEDQKAVQPINKIFCNSFYIQKAIRKIYKKEAIPCHMGVDFEKWEGTTIQPLPEKPTMIAISRIELVKNFEAVLKAIQLAVQKEKKLAEKLKLKIAGKGPDEKRLKNLAKELKIEKLVDFLGFVKEDELPSFYQQGSFAIYLTLDEPMGLIPIEAGFFERATLGSNQGGIPEIIKDQVNGYLVDPSDIELIAQKIIFLCQNRDLLVQLGKNAKKAVTEKFNIKNFINRFHEELSSLKYL